MSIETEVLYGVGNSRLLEYPFPHIYVSDVFPDGFYRDILANLPPQDALKTLGALGRMAAGDYPDRVVMPLTAEHTSKLPAPIRAVWEGIGEWLLGWRFREIVVQKFASHLQKRFKNLKAAPLSSEAFVVRDRTNYALGPHTDSPSKVLSFLFYLPRDAARPHLGTSMYLPIDPTFTCPGGPHHPFENFELMKTMRYQPNALFAFLKTPNAFHGVEKIAEQDVQRDILQFNIKAG